MAHKTGAVNAARTDAGILYLKSGPVALCVLTSENKDQRWTLDNEAELTIAKMGLAIISAWPKK